MTNTRTHVYTKLANPFLVCEQCSAHVESWHDPEACGCGWLESRTAVWNVPCGHYAAVVSQCPSWSPVDGCNCAKQPGVRAASDRADA